MAAAQYPLYPALKGKVVLVTGGARGIGAAITRAFAAQGACVAVNYNRSARPAAALVSALNRRGIEAVCFGADLSDPAAVLDMAAQVSKRLGPVSVLVNNAAILRRGRAFADEAWQDFQAELDVALKGAVLTTQSVLQHMRKAKSGAIVNIITTLTERPISRFSPHTTAKSALLGLTRALAVELGPLGITVNAVSPGYTLSGVTARMPRKDLERLSEATPTGRLSRPKDIAGAVLFLAASRQVTGQCVSVDGGLFLAAQ
jgi:3-oxoacyl-[acyl-carrier protein] reductase